MKTSETNSENKFTSENKFLILLSTEVAEDVNIPDYVIDITEKAIINATFECKVSFEENIKPMFRLYHTSRLPLWHLTVLI